MSDSHVIAVDVIIDAPPQTVWAAVTDWPRQSEWMLGTTVRATDLGGVGVGGGVEAFTGVGRLGVLDTMVITEWDPPRRCVVLHTGRLVQGSRHLRGVGSARGPVAVCVG